MTRAKSTSVRVQSGLIDPKHAAQALLTSSQAREFDRMAVERFHMSSLVLMEHAALGAMRVALAMAPRGAIVIVAGPGNNGGDALAMARLLRNAGRLVRVIALRDEFRGDAGVQRETLGASRWRVKAWESASSSSSSSSASRAKMQRDLSSASLIIDGLFGTGLSRTPEGDALALIQAINNARGSGSLVLALDLPSGLHADKGVTKRWSACVVRADVTATFGGFKPGLLTVAARPFVGAIIPIDLGVPREIYKLIRARLVSETLATRAGTIDHE